MAALLVYLALSCEHCERGLGRPLPKSCTGRDVHDIDYEAPFELRGQHQACLQPRLGVAEARRRADRGGSLPYVEHPGVTKGADEAAERDSLFTNGVDRGEGGGGRDQGGGERRGHVGDASARRAAGMRRLEEERDEPQASGGRGDAHDSDDETLVLAAATTSVEPDPFDDLPPWALAVVEEAVATAHAVRAGEDHGLD